MDIGIDLGTTFSVVAVKGNVELAPSYGRGMYLAECDVTIIPTPQGDFTFPSVLWWDPEQPDTYVVGSEARQKAEEGRRPVMFSKRAIGTSEKLLLCGREFTAREAATHFLRYMKSCAEQALGQPVERAVVTHPAYFDRNQVEETREAAQAAGFTMSPGQMMMEPAAAALAYTVGDERDPLRVMTYDLGGGTFDVTVLEKREGVIGMKAFDGDHLLGGYNFDRLLLQWILDELKAQGRTIPYDETSEEDRGRHARLLQVAESVKIKLSEQRGPKVPVPVKVDFLVDEQGRRVQFVGRITREQFTALIKDKLQETIDHCRRALAKAEMTVTDLDAILLVGGSTYGPWVQEAITEAFHINVEPYNPDLCVAAGAAIEAAKLPKTQAGAEIDLVVDVRPSSPLPTANVPGSIRPRARSRYDQTACRALMVTLLTPEGTTLGPAAVDEDGRFLFQDVRLPDEGEAADFALVVADGARELVRSTFQIVYQPAGAGETTISTTLPKPVFLKTADGLVPIAEEGKELPARCQVRLQKLFDDTSVVVPVLQEFEEIGSIRVDNIPETAGQGSAVVIDVEITQKNEMRGMAKVMTRSNTVVAQREVRISFPPIPIPSLSELHARFEELNDRREQTMLLTEDPEQRLLLAGAGERVARRAQKLFGEQEPDRQEILREVKKLERMVNPPPDDMEPPRTQFTSVLEACREMLGSKPDDPNLQAFHPMLRRIEREATDSYTTKNRKKWAAANESLRQLHGRIDKIVNPDHDGDNGKELPPAPLLKDHFRNQVDGMRSALRLARDKAGTRPDYETKDRPRCDALERELDALEKGIERISDEEESKRALAQCQLLMRPAQRIKDRTRWIDEGVDVTRT